MKYEIEGPTKYLIVCEGGNVRSVALATHLKLFYGREAIAVGWRYVSKKTMAMLCLWADRIVLMQPEFSEHISGQFAEKVSVVDVGQDRWGINIHPELNLFATQGSQWLIDSELKEDDAEQQ